MTRTQHTPRPIAPPADHRFGRGLYLAWTMTLRGEAPRETSIEVDLTDPTTRAKSGLGDLLDYCREHHITGAA